MCLTLLIFTLLFTSVTAEDAKNVSFRWLDDEYQRITDGVNTYEAHYLKPGFFLRPLSVFRYADPPLLDWSTIESYEMGGGILWRYPDVIYTTDDAYEALCRFTEELRVSRYVLTSEQYMHSFPYTVDDFTLTAEEVKGFDDLAKTKTLDVSELFDAAYLRIYAYDETECIVHVHGAFYETEHGILYINEDVLDNSYFNADGEFSFRSVPGYEKTVTGALLSEEEEADLRTIAADRMYSHEIPTTYENENEIEPYERENRLFDAYRVGFGYVLPAFVLALSVFFFFRTNDKKERIRRAIPAGLSLLWIALSIVGSSML